MNPVYAVIMAGGMGERFWPRSRQKTPKQLLPIFSKKSMLEEAVNRIRGFIPLKRIMVVTNKLHKYLVRKQLPFIPEENIISEPLSMNTAPCIALSASLIKKREGGNCIMVVLPADQVVRNLTGYRKSIMDAVKIAAKKKALVILGVKPTSPHTGYGYIMVGGFLEGDFYKVGGFTEKPDLRTAKKYLKTAKYLWNSGMFIWEVDSILEEIDRYIPGLTENLADYSKLPNISIDYGIMEKTKRAVVGKARFSWDDVGSWSALQSHMKPDADGNIVQGNSILVDTKDSIIISDSPLVAALGLEDVVVVATGDAVLVCPKQKAQDVKKIVELLKKRGSKYV